ncbi:hypothetical protein BDK51DRAFT_32426, partial [Blyttiomyces helicus]
MEDNRSPDPDSDPPTAAENEDSAADDNVDWEVEAIVGKRLKPNLRYKVQWKGSPDHSWEPLQNLRGCLELVEEFEAAAALQAREEKRRASTSGSASRGAASKQRSLPPTPAPKDGNDKTTRPRRRVLRKMGEMPVQDDNNEEEDEEVKGTRKRRVLRGEEGGSPPSRRRLSNGEQKECGDEDKTTRSGRVLRKRVLVAPPPAADADDGDEDVPNLIGDEEDGYDEKVADEDEEEGDEEEEEVSTDEESSDSGDFQRRKGTRGKKWKQTKLVESPNRRSERTSNRRNYAEMTEDDIGSAEPRSAEDRLKTTAKPVVTHKPCLACSDPVSKSGADSLKCYGCQRYRHADCDENGEAAEDRGSYLCCDCNKWGGKDIHLLLTWRKVDEVLQYLVKWKETSYREVAWVSASWAEAVSGWVPSTLLKVQQEPSQTEEDVIQREWLEIDKILKVDNETFFCKWKGLGIELSTHEPIPDEDAPDYKAYQVALEALQKINLIDSVNNKPAISKFVQDRSPDQFRELKKQPDYVEGGTLKPYQLEGVNWMIFKYFEKSSMILGDEMGLGKTIQVIAFLLNLYHEHRVFPALIVVPNGTLHNWIREFAKWAPSMQVSLLVGDEMTRDLIFKYEILVEGFRSSTRCHVVVTSFDIALREAMRLNSISWEVLVIDEAHHLKN